MNVRLMAVAACAAAIVWGGVSPALATDSATLSGGVAPASSPDYTPDEPDAPTLAGSTAVPACAQDVPWLDYRVQLNDPKGLSTSGTARLVMTDGTNSVTLALGELAADGTLTGRALWPGASVGPDGVGTGWPGWEQRGGEWIETPGNYAWTRGNITATIEVNPSLRVALSYPPSTPQCATGPHTAVTGVAAGLPATGGSPQTVLVVGAVGVVGVALGAAVVAIRRRRRV